LTLATAWSGFIEEATHGASCLGPLSGLGEKKDMYQKAVESLSDSGKTTLILVARPEESTLLEANRASLELGEIGIGNQMLIINGLLKTHDENDEVSTAFYEGQQGALKKTPEELQEIQKYSLPFVSYSLTGIERLRQIVSDTPLVELEEDDGVGTDFPPLSELKDVIDDFSVKNTRVIFTMGKGGVGKTSVAAAIAVGLTEKGHKVHLTTTDPAAHLDYMFKNSAINGNLSISSIDPEVEVESYKKEVITNASELSDDELSYLQEDLESPCTEEI